MDIVRNPTLLWINNCCYRVPQTSYHGTNESVYTEPADECPEGNYESGDGPCVMDNLTDIQNLPNGRLLLALDIPSGFWGAIIGAKGSTKKRIESETNTVITVPRPTQMGEITIVGSTVQNIESARTRLETIVRDARQKTPYTHFLSIPAGQEIQERFALFKEQAQSLCPEISDDFYTLPGKLHLTINCLLLMDEQDIEEACRILYELKPFILEKLGGKKLNAVVQGLEIMDDDPSKTRVLYGKVDSGLLQEIGNHILSRFSKTDFLKDRDLRESVRLHLTLLNASNAEKRLTENEVPRKGYRWHKPPRLNMDVRPLLIGMRDFYFGVIRFDTIQLSTMGSTGEDGYYVPCASIQF